MPLITLFNFPCAVMTVLCLLAITLDRIELQDSTPNKLQWDSPLSSDLPNYEQDLPNPWCI